MTPPTYRIINGVCADAQPDEPNPMIALDPIADDGEFGFVLPPARKK